MPAVKSAVLKSKAKNATPDSLSDRITIRGRFLRSVNLERDFYAPSPLDGYIPTPAAVSALSRIGAGITDPAARAFSVTGAYGTGKSAFALYLTKLLSFPELRNKTAEAPFPEFAAPSFWPVLVTGGRQALAPALANALCDALQHLARFYPEPAKAALAAIPAPDVLAALSAREVARLYENISARLMERVPGCGGLLVVVDEMGKFLEFAAHHPEKGDVQVLQEMAETAVRSVAAPILFVTILHQAFDEYAHRLGPVQRAEWQKVQGRFADIPFGDAPEENLRLLARAIERSLDAAFDAPIAVYAAAATTAAADLHLVPRALSEDNAAPFRALVDSAYPLHPLTLLLLPHVFRRFGQSERSLFSFLSSEEPNGFRDFLRNHAPALLFRPYHLFDYVENALSTTVRTQPQAARLWRETQESLYRAEGRGALDVRLIKTIGLLHLLSEQTRILPTRDVLRFALTDDETSAEAIDSAIDALEMATLITYRQFKKAFRPYEGSDIDVEERVRDARQEALATADVAAVAARYADIAPMVARRHSFRTGSLRLFETVLLRPDALNAEAVRIPAGSDGLRVLVLCADAAERDAAKRLYCG